MKIVGQVFIGILIAAAVIYGVLLVVDTRTRVVNTSIMVSEIYGRIFPDRVPQPPAQAPPTNQSPNEPKKE